VHACFACFFLMPAMYHVSDGGSDQGLSSMDSDSDKERGAGIARKGWVWEIQINTMTTLQRTRALIVAALLEFYTRKRKAFDKCSNGYQYYSS
jgi:hypothetical protein